MKKYLRLVCTTCGRTIDKLVDNRHAVPDKCVITLKCQGRLTPLEYRSNSEISVAPAAGLTDWYPRNDVIASEVAPIEEVLINTSTGSTQQLVLALYLPSAPAASASARLNLNVRSDSPKDYQQFVFRFDTTFKTVSGVETSLEKKTLRFTGYGLDPDLVEVYVNGVKAERGTAADQYQINLGTPSTSAIPPNMVSFNKSISLSGTTQVDVIVSKVVALATRTLTFQKNANVPARQGTGAWENVESYDRFIGGVTKRFYLFTCDIKQTANIDINTILVPSGDVSVDGIATPVSQTDAYFMLARKPYSMLDRYPDTVVCLDTMSIDRDYLKFHLVGGIATLEIAETSVTSLYPPARLNKFVIEHTIKTPLAGATEQITVDGAVIVGPDI